MLTLYKFPLSPISIAAPLFLENCQAGFPSPAQDYVERELDLNEYCVMRPAATFFVRASGQSMTDIGLNSGDLMVVDKAESPRHGDIVIAEIEGEFTVKRLLLRPRLTLQPMNPSFSPIYPDPETLQIFGVVIREIRRMRRDAMCQERSFRSATDTSSI